MNFVYPPLLFSSSAKHISLIRMYSHSKPARVHGEMERERESGRGNYHYSKLYMMQKQTHSKHHLSVIIVQRDYSRKGSFYFIFIFRSKERERERSNKRISQPFKCDNETGRHKNYAVNSSLWDNLHCI